MATDTTNYAFKMPTVSGDSGVWGGYLNDNWESTDQLLGGESPITGIDINSGAIDNATIGAATPNTGAFTTLSASSTFTLGGTAITSTGVEINILDGVTSTTAELNILDGVTSTTAELNILDGVTSTAAEINILDGVTSTTAELNILDGVTSTATELNYVDIAALGTSEASKAVTADANGDVSLAEELKAKSYNETYEAPTSSSNAITVNCENGNSFQHTLTENTTFTFSNPPTTGTGYAFTLKMVQDAGASGFTVTWPGALDWPAATAPTMTATASAVDVFVFFTTDGGTTWYGFTAGQALA